MAEQAKPEQAKTAEDVKALVAERDIRFIRFWFTDILGQLKSFSINAAELDDAFEAGMGFDGSSITGFNAIEESDMIAMPDPSDVRGAALASGGAGRGADVLRRRSPPSARRTRATRATCCAARWSARRRWASTPSTSGPSSSTSCSATHHATEVLDQGGYFDLTTLDAGSDVRRETVLALEQLGIHVEYTHHEVGPSQHEIDMRYADALKMADDCMTYRITVKEYAMKYGWHATFMPKPLFGENGSGMHTHQSLFAEGRNAFFDPDDQYFLSDVGKAFIAGQLKHAREICSIFAQWVNSYKRLVPGFEAPVYVAWSRRNRSALVRVPLYHPGAGAGDAHGAALPRPGVQPLPDVRRAAAGGARGDREGLRAARADGEEPLPPLQRGAPPPGHRAAARDARRGDRAAAESELAAAHARRAHVQPLRRDQAPGVGGLPGAGHPLGAGPLPLDPVGAAGGSRSATSASTDSATCMRIP